MSKRKMNIPAIIEYDAWASSPLSIAKFYGGITIGGHEYLLLDSKEPAQAGCYKPDLVRKDWCGLYRKLQRGIEEYIAQGLTPAQVKKILKEQENARTDSNNNRPI